MKESDIEKFSQLDEEMTDRAQLILDTFYPQKAFVSGVTLVGTMVNMNNGSEKRIIEFDGNWMGPINSKTLKDENGHTCIYMNNEMMFENDVEFLCEVPYEFFTMEESELEKHNKEELKITLFNNTGILDEEFFN